MAYTSPLSSPSHSDQGLSPLEDLNNSLPRSDASSPSTSPTTMLPAGTDPDSPKSTRGTPNRLPLDLPRTQAASKGGCWTCRLRRKKCDEQRQGDSCHTCVRLKIKCLGWGPKRPDWMRDKQAVEAYKADIKAQLTRAGLIRGQPRTTPMTSQQQQASSSRASSSSRPHHITTASPTSSLLPSSSFHHDPTSTASPNPSPSSALDFSAAAAYHNHPFAGHSIGIGLLGVGGSTSSSGIGHPLQHHHPHQFSASSSATQDYTSHQMHHGMSLGLGLGLGFGGGGGGPYSHYGGVPEMPGLSNSIFAESPSNPNPNPSTTSLESTSASTSTSTSSSSPNTTSLNALTNLTTTHTHAPRDIMDPNFFSFHTASANTNINTTSSSPLHTPGSSSTSSHHHLHPHQQQQLSHSHHGTPSIPTLPTLPTTAASSSSAGAGLDFVNVDFTLPPTPTTAAHTQVPRQQDLVMYYFEHVRKVQYIFAGNSVTNVTYSLILQEPRGAVTNAVCALASLHHTGMRVAQGLEPPDPNPEYSTARYFRDEAYLQLVNAQAIKGRYDEGDAIAALHLVSFSLFSGGATDWRQVLSVAYEWVAQSSGLMGGVGDADVKAKLAAMRPIEQLIVKTTMWFDVFSSISLLQPPKFLGLWKRLLTPTYWTGTTTGLSGDDHLTTAAPSSPVVVHMESLMGCPDDAVLAIAEISALAHWKANEIRHGRLSIRELLRRGDAIEASLRAAQGTDIFNSPGSPLHPNLAQQSAAGNGDHHPPQPGFPTNDMRRLVASIYRESAMVYLQTIINGCNPGVPEVGQSVDAVVHLFQQLPRSEVDRSLVFPICITGCMTDNSPQREFLKGRLQAQDESWGNVMQTRALMESVWRKRDVGSGMAASSHHNGMIAVDWRESLGEHPALLLV